MADRIVTTDKTVGTSMEAWDGWATLSDRVEQRIDLSKIMEFGPKPWPSFYEGVPWARAQRAMARELAIAAMSPEKARRFADALRGGLEQLANIPRYEGDTP